MKNVFLWMVLMLAGATAATAQPHDLAPRQWYPLETGNYWLYRNVGTSVDYDSRHVVATTRDSLVEGSRWTLFELAYTTLPPERAYAAAPLGWQRLTDDFYLLQTFDFARIDTLWRTEPHALFAADVGTDSSLAVIHELPGQNLWRREPAVVTVDADYQAEPCCRDDSTNFQLLAELWQTAHGPYQVQLVYNLGHVRSGSVYSDVLEGALVDGRSYGDTTLIGSVLLPVEERAAPRPAPRLDVYPNPARGQATITLGASMAGRYTLRLFNLLGQQMYHEQRWMPAGAQARFALDIRALNLPGGVYLARVRGPLGRSAGTGMVVVR